METSVISVPALSFPVPEAKYLVNPSVLEPALKVVPMSTVSDLAASQLTGVSIIPAFAGLVLVQCRKQLGFQQKFQSQSRAF